MIRSYTVFSTVPRPARTDPDDVIAAVTADPLWMLGVQWRLGEHAGENAATPVRLDIDITETTMDPPLATTPVEAIVEDEEKGHWDSAELAFNTTIHADTVKLDIRRHPGGPIDWWATTADGVTTGTARDDKIVPTRLRWPGAPRRRYWQLDDIRRDPAGAGPDTSHPSTLILLEVVSRHSDDWYLAPLPATPGTVVRPATAKLIDAAGGSWNLRTPGDWSLYAVHGLDPPAPAQPDQDDPDAHWHRALPVFATAVSALTGPPIEEVGLAVDEDANVLWAGVLRLDGKSVLADELPFEAPASTTDDGQPFTANWRLAARPPDNRAPYLYGATYDPPAFGAGEDLFVQARMIDPTTGSPMPPPAALLLSAGTDPEAPPTHILRPLAVPATGLRLQRHAILARAVDGRPVRWIRRTRHPLDVAVDAPPSWDILNGASLP